MQVVLFHLMPYAEIDLAAARAHGTVWGLPNKHYDPHVAHRLYNRFLDELEYGEALGFDAVSVNEHHQTAYGLMPSPIVMASALARRTKRVKIAILGSALPLRTHPMMVAEEHAMIDVISGGRLISGFVRGIGAEYHTFGVNPTFSHDRFHEAHDLIVRAWTEKGPFSFQGHHYRVNYVNLWPQPLQQPHPPIYIPGAGSTETMRFCAERRYTFMSVYAPTRVVARWFDGYRQAAQEAGYVPDPEKIAWSVPIYVAETDEQAHREAEQHVLWLFRKGLKQGPELINPPGYMSQSSLRGVLKAGMPAFSEMSSQDLLAGGHVGAGSPETVTAQLRELQEELGFGQLIGLFAIGDIPHERTVRSMELFAAEVMPALRPLGVAAAAAAAS
jgi:alkanesulfonate monooxygenase SsuD/methylene tetrahydromethanopterin reductase-like flavin-dependent oxidoreductase (luciferase family)